MRKIIFLISGVILIFGCNDQNKNEVIVKNKINQVDCEKLNDSAMNLLTSGRGINKSVELISLAVECNPKNKIFIRNKGMILANAGLNQECINYLEKHKNEFTKLEYLSTTAECYFNLKDSVKFNFFKESTLNESKLLFNKSKDESNLITYLTILKKFSGEDKMREVIDSNKKVFTTPDMYGHMLPFLEKVSTLKI